jgi:hypothetical protein
MPNGDHVVLQVKMNGDVYRMVANVQSDRGNDLDVRFGQFAFPLPAPAFAEGWHSGVTLDYPTLGAHADAGFESLAKDDLVTRVVGELHIGANVSVYATVGNGRPESAHLIHRNDGKADGAIVVAPESNAPSFLLFHFADQSF